MSIADFSVDPSALELLRFNTAIERMLSGDAVVLDHPGVDWSTQSQHLFRDNMRVAAARLIVSTDDAPSVVMDYAQFINAVPDPSADPAFQDLAFIFERCQTNLVKNPIFWLRLVGYGYACTRLLESQGTALGFKARSYRADELLSAAAQDAYISSMIADYTSVIERVVDEPL